WSSRPRPEAGNAAPHEPGIPSQKMSRVDPCLLESAGQEILDDDVRALDELYDERAIHSATQIGCDAQLVPVDTEVVRTLAALSAEPSTCSCCHRPIASRGRNNALPTAPPRFRSLRTKSPRNLKLPQRSLVPIPAPPFQ